LVPLHTIDRQKLYKSIVDQIVDGVRTGAFPAGRPLPAERVLAVQLGVSRGLLREGIRVLEHAGILNVRPGSGTYVAEDGTSQVTMLRAEAAMLGQHSPLDIISARRAVEITCAELAAVHHTRRDIDTLRKSIVEQGELIARGEESDEVDWAFHLAVAEASQNPVLLALVERLVDIMRQPTWRNLKHQTRDRPGSAEEYLDQHRAILLAVERYDGPAAAAAMMTHLVAIEDGLLDVIREPYRAPPAVIPSFPLTRSGIAGAKPCRGVEQPP
jgi:GntR family transcriptional repressor for pyruvate dehydrogenase complex